MEKVDADIKCEEKTEDSGPVCGQETDTCCYGYFELSLIEVIYLFNMMNRTLKSQTREAVIHEACKVRKKIRGLQNQINHKMVPAGDSLTALKKAFIKEKNLCPLNMESKCLLFEYRPIRCRCDGIGNDAIDIKLIEDTLNTLSRNVFFAFSGHFLEDDGLSFSPWRDSVTLDALYLGHPRLSLNRGANALITFSPTRNRCYPPDRNTLSAHSPGPSAPDGFRHGRSA